MIFAYFVQGVQGTKTTLHSGNPRQIWLVQGVQGVQGSARMRRCIKKIIGHLINLKNKYFSRCLRLYPAHPAHPAQVNIHAGLHGAGLFLYPAHPAHIQRLMQSNEEIEKLRMEHEANHVLNLNGLAARRAYLVLVGTNRGKEAKEALEAAVLALWDKWRKACK